MRKSGVLFLILMLVPLVAAGDGVEKHETASEEPVAEDPSMENSAGNQTGNSTSNSGNQTNEHNSTSEDEISGEDGDARLHTSDRPCDAASIKGGTTIRVIIKIRIPVVIDPNDCFTYDNDLYSLLP